MKITYKPTMTVGSPPILHIGMGISISPFEFVNEKDKKNIHIKVPGIWNLEARNTFALLQGLYPDTKASIYGDVITIPRNEIESMVDITK